MIKQMIMDTFTTAKELQTALYTHFKSHNCTIQEASRDAILSLIPHLSRSTQLDMHSIVVNTSGSRSWCHIYYYCPLLNNLSFTVTSKAMSSSALLRMLSRSHLFSSSKFYFYDV